MSMKIEKVIDMCICILDKTGNGSRTLKIATKTNDKWFQIDRSPHTKQLK